MLMILSKPDWLQRPLHEALSRNMKMSYLSLLCAFAVSVLSVAANAQQLDDGELGLFGDSPPLLSPEEAFQGELTHSKANGALQLAYKIEEGYYLYRDRFTITPANDSLTLAETQWPEAEIYEDEYFGESAIYRNAFQALVPIQSAGPGTQTVNVTYQGCADIGVCFPPVTQSFDLTGLDAPVSALDKLKSLSSANQVEGQSPMPLESASSLLRSNEDELLAPSEAYRPFIDPTPTGLSVSWDIEPGYYLYRDKLSYTLASNAGEIQTFSDTVLAKGEMYKDEFFGETQILRFEATDQLVLAQGSSGDGVLTLNYQGCADIGVCFPPEQFSVPVSWNTSSADAAVVANASVASGGSGGGIASENQLLQAPEQDQIATRLATSSLWFNILAFYVGGLLLAFTPCVLPMFPILSSIILGGGEKQTTRQAFGLSLVYVIGMALTYTIVGVLVGLSGYNIQAWFQNPIILSVFAGLFVLFAFAMFGAYEMQLPAGLQTRLMSISNKQSGGRKGGVFVMGVLSAIIVGPCVTAPLMGALIYIADTGNAVVGGTALFALSIGMGTPLLLIGTSAGSWVPKAGGWMNAIKIIFGFLMLAMAIWMLSRFLAPNYVVLLSCALALITGVWAILEYSKSENSMALRTIGTAAGVAASIYGASLLIGTLAGAPNLMSPLKGLSAPISSTGGGAANSNHLAFNRVKSMDDLTASVAAARAEGKPVMLDFYADWCVSCKEMEAFTFTDPKVQAMLEDVTLLQADVTLNDKDDQGLLKHFGLFGPPAIIFYDTAGNEIRNARLVGFLDAEKFSGHLNSVLAVGSSKISLQNR